MKRQPDPPGLASRRAAVAAVALTLAGNLSGLEEALAAGHSDDRR